MVMSILVITLGMFYCKRNSVESLAAVQDDNYNWGYIDKTGKVVIQCKWKYA